MEAKEFFSSREEADIKENLILETIKQLQNLKDETQVMALMTGRVVDYGLD